MKAKDLRIGNLINDPYDEPTEVTVELLLAIISIEKERQNAKDYYKPIALKEGWLQNFGFDHFDKHEMSLKINENLVIYYDFHIKELELATVDKDVNFNKFKHIKYVHQLQNFHHSITGEELKINYEK